MSIFDILNGGLMGGAATPGIDGASPAQGIGGLMMDPKKMMLLQMGANMLQASQGQPGQGRPGLGGILGSGAQGALQGIQNAHQMQMQQASLGAFQEKLKIAKDRERRYEEFVKSPDFAQLPPPVRQAIESGGPEMLDQFYKGQVEQASKGPETKVVGNQLLRIDQTGKPEVIHTAPRDRQPTAYEQKLQGLMSAGVPRETALGIASGRFTVSINPMTNERQVIDIATGQPVGGAPEGPAPSPATGSVPPDIEPEAGTGLSGMLSNTVNVISDALGQGLAYPKAKEASEAMKNLKVQTMGALQEGIPGRPSTFLLQRLEALTVDPNSITTGDAGAKVRFQQTRDLIAEEVARIDRDILNVPGAFKPEVIQKARQNKSQLESVRASYDQILGAYENKSAGRPSLEEIFGE